MPIWATSIAPDAKDDAVDDHRDDANGITRTWRWARQGIFELSANPAGGAMVIKMELVCLKAKMKRRL